MALEAVGSNPITHPISSDLSGRSFFLYSLDLSLKIVYTNFIGNRNGAETEVCMNNGNTKKVNRFSLTPDYVFDTYLDITPEFLSSLGIKALLIDIDNTLAPYEQPLPDEKMIEWFASLKKNEIKASLISNNHKERVELFNSLLHLPAYPDSKKPCVRILREAIEKMGAEPRETAGLGDQLLTDTLAAHRLGTISLIVPPIKDKLTPFFRFKRWLERPFMKKYYRIHNDNSKKGKNI